MTNGASEILRLLELELDILEKGGAGRSARDPRKREPVFEHTVTCINHWLVPGHDTECCDGCVLLDFVPEKFRAETTPCHFIPLDEKGSTIAELDRTEGDEELVETVKAWLRSTIARLKAESQAGGKAPEVEY